MNLGAVIIMCLCSLAAGYLVGEETSKKSYREMLAIQKQMDDEVIHRLTEYIKNHIKKDTEGKTDEKIH